MKIDKYSAIKVCEEAFLIYKVQRNDLEVDFICTKYEEKIYIQVAYLLASEEPIEREFSVLELIKDNFPKYVISMDQFDMSRNGIKHYNIIDFLLEE